MCNLTSSLTAPHFQLKFTSPTPLWNLQHPLPSVDEISLEYQDALWNYSDDENSKIEVSIYTIQKIQI